MSLMTPRGLKVRIELPWAFGLLARLFIKDRRTDAFRVLKTCEAIECIPAALSFIAGIGVAWYAVWPTWTVCAAQIAGMLIGKLSTQTDLMVLIRPLGLLALGRIWSWLHGYGLLLFLALCNSWIARDWQGALWWIAGVVATFVTKCIVDYLLVRWRFKRGGAELAFTSAEVNFFSAYLIHAKRVDAVLDLNVSDEEVETGNWRICLMDYAAKWPGAVARFPNQRELMNAIAPRGATLDDSVGDR